MSRILWFIFIPRWYKYKPQWYKYNPKWFGQYDENIFSPFSRMILYENNDDIYDNPAIQAVINFHWSKARNFMFFLFLRFLIFVTCFAIVCWVYFFGHGNMNEKGLIALIIIFYYMASYLLITELLQLHYRGPRKYFGSIFNCLDITSVVLPVITMSIILKFY